MNKPTKDYIALLTITEFPKTSKENDRLIEWLISKVDELREANPHDYCSPCRFRLMK